MPLDVVLFEGENTSNQLGLWETNGTATGTFELAPIGGAYTGPTLPIGLAPSNLTSFNGGALFEGLNASRDLGLWTTDGTAAGTMELTGIAGANSFQA